MSKLLESALYYRNHFSFSVIPVGKNKKPLIKWEEFQTRKATEDEISAWWGESPDANIGIVTGEISGIVVVDVDKPEQAEELSKYIPDSTLAPTCTTPRGGHHIYFKCPNSEISNATGIIPAVDFRGNGGYVLAPPSENGNGNKYEWTVKPTDCTFPSLPTSLLSLLMQLNTNRYNNSFNTDLARREKDHANNDLQKPFISFQEGSRDNDIFHVANSLVRGGMSFENSYKVLEILAKNCSPPFPENEIRFKIESAIKRSDKREINFSKEIREWAAFQTGWFCLSDLRYLGGFALHLLTRNERNNIYVVMNRLSTGKDRILEKHPSKSGCYRRIERDLREIDLSAPMKPAKEIRFPLEIEHLVNIKPKNIVVIWSGPDGGKSAFCFNFSMLNMHKHEIFYFSSEMGEDELVSRLQYFKIPMQKWMERVHFYEKSTNFADVVNPNGINIIDYLEVHEDFSLVAKYIRDIWENLEDGIAVICVQSKYNADLPRGGEFAIEKARLAISLVRDKKDNICRIKKAKNWYNTDRNPNGLQKHFFIVEGCKILEAKGSAGNWLRDGELETIEKERGEW